MKFRLFWALLGFATVTNAHFIFVVPLPGGANAQVFVSENLKPDADVGAGLAGRAQLSLRDPNGRETPLVLVKSEHAYLASLPGTGTRLIHGTADLGVMQQGPDKSYLLRYYPKAILGDPFDSKTVVGNNARVEIVPVGKPGAVRLELLVWGKPQQGGEITVIRPDGSRTKVVTDRAGLTQPLGQTGRYGAWARHWEAGKGLHQGKAYDESHDYATLVFDTSPSSETAKGTLLPVATRFATLPQAASSFGAVISDGFLYVYGGHIAPTHSYSTQAVSGRFARLNLSGGAAWEELPEGTALQGMNLAAYKGQVYRIGGMSPRNEPGTAQAIFSVAECARFDPRTMKWHAIASLPEPRSSHDVAVIGDKLIVVGGWTLNGSQPTKWLDTLAVMDLGASKPEWKSAPQPFKRRALIAAAFAGRLYVMGGFDEKGKVVHDVSIYDPASGAWTKGPDLPGTGIDGFAPAACVHDGRLYVSVADGALYRLGKSGLAWEKAGTVTPRVADRLASDGKAILVIGGASGGHNTDLIESVAVDD